MRIKTVLLFLLVSSLTHCAQFWDYTYGSTLNCTQTPDLNQDIVWSTLRLHVLDRYSFMILSPIIIVLMVLVLITFMIKQSRSTPGDIIFALAICEVLVIGAAFIQAIYQTDHQTSVIPPGFLKFCDTIAVFTLVGWIGLNYYNMIFCFVLAHNVRNTLKGTLLSPVGYHIAGLIVMGLFPLIIYLTNGIGRGINSICAVRYSNAAPFIVLAAPMILIVVAIVSVYRFRTGIPQNSFFKKQSVYSFYFLYIFIVIMFQLLISILALIGDLNCKADEPNPALAVCFSISNIATLFHPIMIVFIRFKHPGVQRALKKIKDKITKTEDQALFQSAISGQNDEIQMENFNWLGSLLESIRGSQVFSFLTGMLITHIEFKNESGSIKEIDFTTHYVFKIDEFSADTYLEKRVNPRASMKVNKELGGIKPLDFEVTSYCPRFFHKITEEMSSINLQTSLSIILNSETIKDVATTDGGKSGQFFFCSHDSHILFKTISAAQAEILLQNIQKFYDYYREEPNSLISKIIGLYRFSRTDIADTDVYIILQKNLSMCNRANIQRVFDLKGSKYNRQTLSEKKVTDLSTVTLKDIDFINTQQKIYISPLSIKNIKRILTSDIRFLQSIKVMDYSLLIMKVNWGQIAFFKSIQNTDSIIPNRSNVFQIVASEPEEGIYYHFAVIDYLQTWNTKKQAENIFKKVIVREFTESVVTVEEPKTYATRLINFLDTIFS